MNISPPGAIATCQRHFTCTVPEYPRETLALSQPSLSAPSPAMAKPGSLIRHVEAFVNVSCSPEQQSSSLNAVGGLVKNDLISIQGLVRELELYLTTTDNVVRARGILLLGEVLTLILSKPLDHASVQSLAAFFTSRLADWQALRGALIGCLALLRRKNDVGMVEGSDARALAKSFLQNVQVQSLAMSDRKLCFELLRCLLDVYPKHISLLGEDIVHGICEAIDGEKDPRCLMSTFQLVKSLAQLFPEPSGPLASHAAYVFEVISRYFPAYFTHPKSEGLDIRREDLSMALMSAFCSTPFFEQFSIPLVLEKLSSSLLLAKLDSLKYLKCCICSYGAHRMSKHAKVIWLSLKDVIFNFQQKPFTTVWEGESESHQIGREALKCLRAAILHLNDPDGDTFADVVIEDESFEVAFSSAIFEGNPEMSTENWHRLSAVCGVLCELAKVSNSCCDKVISGFFPRLMGSLGVTMSENSFSDITFERRVNFGALYMSVELLSSCRELAISSKDHSEVVSVDNKWCCLLQNFSIPLGRALCVLIKLSSCGGQSRKNGVGDLAYEVKGLQMLATFPNYSLYLSKTMYEDILKLFVAMITGQHVDTSLWKLTLQALVQIGFFFEECHDIGKQMSFLHVVVEEILLLLHHVDSVMPLSQKLEILYSIGSTATEFMLRVIHNVEEAMFSSFLEVFAKEKKVTRTLVQLLDFYSTKMLPWCKTAGQLDTGMRFVVYIWDQMEQDNDTVLYLDKDVQSALMKTMKSIVASFGVEYQTVTVKKAYNILLSKKFFALKELKTSSINLEDSELAPFVMGLSSEEELLVSLFASVVMALRPETLIPDTCRTTKMLLLFLLKGHVPAAQALGSLFNKWSSQSAAKPSTFLLEEALELILEKGLFVILDDALMKLPLDMGGLISFDARFNYKQILVHALVGVAWIGKGLLMRGHEKVENVVMLLLKCLLSGDTMMTIPLEEYVGINANRDDMVVVLRHAADACHVLLSDSEECLNKEFHVTIKPLYKQRIFSGLIPTLSSSIKNCKSPTTRAALYQAFGHVVADTPLAAVIMEARKLILLILDALSILSRGNLNKDLIYSLLLVLSGILMDENGREVVIENAHTFIGQLIGVISYPHKMLVRETAIQCLLAMSELSYTRIYPMRPQVVRAVSRALDDPKRPVRLEAVRCRQAWASIASSGLHY